MKKRIKHFLQRLAADILPQLTDIGRLSEDLRNTQLQQRQLALHYQHLHRSGQALPHWGDTGFRIYSQNDEDGLLLYLFALLGTCNKTCVDIAFGNPHGANTTNLLCNWGWHGLLLDGNPSSVELSRKFFSSHVDTWIHPPCIQQAWVTAENINTLLEDNGFTGEIDLLSIDIDGIDYWLWKSLHIIQPRVVVVEYANFWGAEDAVTVPYKADFNRHDIHPDFLGASLAAFVKLGHEKGYRLVGANRYGFNAFFVRHGLGEDAFPEVPASSCLLHPQAIAGRKSRLPAVRQLPWARV